MIKWKDRGTSILKFLGSTEFCMKLAAFAGVYYENERSSRIWRVLLKLYSLFLMGLFMYLLMNEFEDYAFRKNSDYSRHLTSALIIKITFLLLVALITKQKYVRDFIASTYRAAKDVCGDIDLESRMSLYVTIYLLCHRIAYLYLDHTPKLTYVFIIFKAIGPVANNFASLSVIIIFDVYRKAMTALRKAVTSKLEEENLTDEEKNVYLRVFGKCFTDVVDNLQTCRDILRLQCVPDIICKVATLMLPMQHILSGPDKVWDISLPWVLETICQLILIFTPAILMEMAAKDAEEMQSVIANELLTYTDKKFRTTLYGVLQCFKYAPITFSLWRGYPYNMSFIRNFIYVYAVFTIAMLQFKY